MNISWQLGALEVHALYLCVRREGSPRPGICRALLCRESSCSSQCQCLKVGFQMAISALSSPMHHVRQVRKRLRNGGPIAA